MACQQIQTEITLKGSTDIVKEFFHYSINSILYQRGIYPPESFSRVSEYGLTMLVTTDAGLMEYFKNVLGQMADWLQNGNVQKLVVVVTGVDTKEVLERWVFNVETDKGMVDGTSAPKTKSMKDIKHEIQAIIRQITASVTFLPMLDEPCSFDLLVYTDNETKVPKQWEESDPQFIADSTDVRLRSFTTKVHKVDTMVSYKNREDDI